MLPPIQEAYFLSYRLPGALTLTRGPVKADVISARVRSEAPRRRLEAPVRTMLLSRWPRRSTSTALTLFLTTSVMVISAVGGGYSSDVSAARWSKRASTGRYCSTPNT